MAEKKAPEFPIVLEKGTGKDATKRTVHSVIGLRQAETEGFTLPKAAKPAGGNGESSGRQAGGAKQSPKK